MENQDSLLTIIQDITAEEKELEHQYQLKMKTVEAAQMVIDKQMMVAQEIAGLLGETTAETKATLNQLKRSMLEAVSYTHLVVTQTGCIGLCQYEPIVEVLEPGKEKVTYVKMNVDKAMELSLIHI